MWLGMLGAASVAWAQSGVIAGQVADAAGGAILDVEVVAVNADGKEVRRVLTNDYGFYQLRPLPAGTYTLRYSAVGFRPAERAGLVLRANQLLEVGVVHLQEGSS
jgi:hypothetical protein